MISQPSEVDKWSMDAMDVQLIDGDCLIWG